MGSLANRTIGRLKDFRSGDVGNRVSQAMGSLADQFVDGVQTWGSKATKAAKQTDGLVRSNPWQTAGALALVGLAAGILVSKSAQRARRHANNRNSARTAGES